MYEVMKGATSIIKTCDHTRIQDVLVGLVTSDSLSNDDYRSLMKLYRKLPSVSAGGILIRETS